MLDQEIILSSFIFSLFNDVLAGNQPMFADPGTDSFAGTNVMSIAVELPKSMVGSGDSVNIWVESKRKQ